MSYPLCCPSRATYLTGQYAHNHGVRNTPPHGGDEALDARHTLPVWLQRRPATRPSTSASTSTATGFARPNVPPGWTDWHGTIDKSTYQMWGYKVDENGTVRTYGSFHDEDPAIYQTDVLAGKAVGVIRARADSDAPYFLSLAFVAPHGEVTSPGGDH